MPSLAVTLVVVPAALLEVVLLPTPTLLLVLLVLLELPPLTVLLRADPEALLALVNPLAGLVLKLVLVLLLPTHPRLSLVHLLPLLQSRLRLTVSAPLMLRLLPPSKSRCLVRSSI